jgi:hypothetical protein
VPQAGLSPGLATGRSSRRRSREVVCRLNVGQVLGVLVSRIERNRNAHASVQTRRNATSQGRRGQRALLGHDHRKSMARASHRPRPLVLGAFWTVRRAAWQRPSGRIGWSNARPGRGTPGEPGPWPPPRGARDPGRGRAPTRCAVTRRRRARTDPHPFRWTHPSRRRSSAQRRRRERRMAPVRRAYMVRHPQRRAHEGHVPGGPHRLQDDDDLRPRGGDPRRVVRVGLPHLSMARFTSPRRSPRRRGRHRARDRRAGTCTASSFRARR